MISTWFTKQDISDYPPSLEEIQDLNLQMNKWARLHWYFRLISLVLIVPFTVFIIGIDTWEDTLLCMAVSLCLYTPVAWKLPSLTSKFYPISCSINDEEFIFPTITSTFDIKDRDNFAHFKGEAARYVRNTQGRQLYQLDYDICIYLDPNMTSSSFSKEVTNG
tara:strand:- start:4612 stop:5100 length:489 start_codon:yes stop_codon:yes gene_type:complete